MRLLPREADKLALHNAGFLAQKRLARGLRLNYTEAVALIAAQVSQDAAAPPTSAGLLVKTGYSVCVCFAAHARPPAKSTRN
jgi:urease gamma subunit